MKQYQIITFYEFKDLTKIGDLEEIRESLKLAMREYSIFGTIILAAEGFNSTVCGELENVEKFIRRAESILETRLKYKSSFHDGIPFRRVHVKIKPEIVTLKKRVEIEKGIGTHVSPREWNEIISDEETVILDTRNDYEYKVGTFQRAINPETRKFSELPEFVEKALDPAKHKKIAMFCTGGIRCEKFAPFVKGLGFEEVYQLEGGILKYLEEIPAAESLWQGECFVFDRRVSVDEKLQKGNAPDLSLENK
ncbi:MAG: rhodanese-like domain-containing protein [Acidobacteriota bacterium]|nr:rhodanese-like domain-containing protein [Acidobacteriota bacterium]